MLGSLRSEQGFTLLELTLVFVIIAILIGLALPTFFSTRKSAQDRAAQSSVRHTLTAAKGFESYSTVTVGALSDSEPSLAFVNETTSTASPKTVSVGPASSYTFTAAAYSKSGHCWYARDFLVPGAPNAGTTWNESVSNGSDCMAANAPAAGWSRTF